MRVLFVRYPQLSRGAVAAEVQRELTDLSGVIAVVHREADELLLERRVARRGDARELRRCRGADGVDQLRVIVVEQLQVLLPRGVVGFIVERRPPRFANAARKRWTGRVVQSFDQQVASVCEMENELPDGVSE